MIIEQKVTLENMLNCREKRAEKQQYLLAKYHQPVVFISLVWPGEVKDSSASRYVMELAVKTMNNAVEHLHLHTSHHQCEHLITGPEAFYCLPIDNIGLSILDLKKLCVRLERAHPLGRLWDIDVINTHKRPISRSEVGLPPRRCLLCEKPAHLCARSHAHDVHTLINTIHRRIDEFKQRAGN
ncbi:citrate lyase holo-[acyl-carrier protein] synthase [Providencia sp. PROV130]|uniref:citrate lyase holo-[acyl-carrier protein] synthase n=1 Tax=Providencia sp. PROV130 TaxID=2949840 RepID=UPI00234A2B0F|nr:citrate lyase holo-[acyl-carrier protein] synthase [Providencia sp. PROV130]